MSTPNLTTTTTMIDQSTNSSSSLSPLHRSYHHLNPSPATSSGERQPPATQPQWAHHETVELIAIRGELEREFSASKRNKSLWETVASRMRERGFNRSPHQCKCKWKNLLIRYKGKETSNPVDGKQFPYFEELHAIFSERAKTLQKNLMESQQVAVVQSRKRMKSDNGDQFSDYLSQDEGEEGGESDDEILTRSIKPRKRKIDEEKHAQVNAIFDKISGSGSIEEMLRVFFEQQKRIEMRWRESMERHYQERELFEEEWRESMEKLERERLMMEKEWMEREEQWKIREEIRAEKMDALLTTLLNKLISEDHA